MRNRLFLAGGSSAAPLRLLFRLRWLALAGQLLTIAGAVWWLEVPLPVPSLLSIVALLGLFNLFTAWQLRREQSWPRTGGMLLLQIGADILALTGLLYFAGGAANPFVSLYLLPISIAAALLPLPLVLGLTLLTLACYSALMVWHVPLPHIHAFGHDQFWGHQIGMWLTFVIAAGLIVWFLSQAARLIRERDRQLQLAREKALRNEHILSLATLAASTAHELGTPLATLALLTDELRQDQAMPTAAVADLQLMAEQISRMKRLLSEISGRADVQADHQPSLPLSQWLDRLLDDWRLLRPGIELHCHTDAIEGVLIGSQAGLAKALHNLLNNAADVSPGAVELLVSADRQQLCFEVLDRGPGLAPEVAQLVGDVPVSTKEQGLGIGLLLTHASIEQLGGEVAVFNRPGGGTRIRVTLPRQQLEATT